MTTPNRRPGYKSSSSTGPFRSLLRQLLDEIRAQERQESAVPPVNSSLEPDPHDGGETPATIETDANLGGAHDGPAGDAPRPIRPTLSSLQIPESRFITQPVDMGHDIDRASSPLMFCDSDISFTPSPTEPPTSAVTEISTDMTPPTSALTASSTNTTTAPSRLDSWLGGPRKRGGSDDTVESRSLSKKMRTMALPETLGGFVIFDDGSHEPSSTRGLSGDNRRVIRNTAFIERAPAPLLLTTHHNEQIPELLPELSSFRPEIATPEGLPPAPATVSQPKTPGRDRARRYPSVTPEPPETPSYMRSLHLMDTSDELRHDISIYKNAHGEEWKRNSLCKPCFQRRGTFNRILTYGYEACGRDEALDSHYWEPTICPHY